jgi:hypothetical protein
MNTGPTTSVGGLHRGRLEVAADHGPGLGWAGLGGGANHADVSLGVRSALEPELGVLRCVDHQGRKIAVIGQAGHVRTLVASCKASDPNGMALKDVMFPVVINGWLASH